MAKFIPIRVQKRFMKSKRRIPVAQRFRGETGQFWIDVNMDNTFVDIDNNATVFAPILVGESFDEANMPGTSKTIRAKRIFGMMRGFGTFDNDLFPYVDYDVALVVASNNLTASTTQLADLVENATNAVGQDFRVLQHKRITVVNQFVDIAASLALTTDAGIESRWNFDFDNGLHLNTEQTLYMAVSQCASELYTNGMASLFQGYVRIFAQLK